MTTFSAGEAAFEGFRLSREQPRTILVWAIFHFVVSVVSALVLISMSGDVLELMERSDELTPDEVTQMMMGLAPSTVVLAPLGLAVMAVIAAAVYRLHLRPQEAGLGYLRLGADEVRLAALTIIYYFLSLIGLLALIFLSGVAAGIAAVIGAGSGGLVAIGVFTFCLGLWLFTLVRLSLAPVITFDTRRLSVFESWRLTKGRFLGLFGAYVLAVATIIVVSLLMMVIFTAVAGVITVMGGGSIQDVSAVFQPDLSSVGAYFSVQTVAYLIFNALIMAIYYPVLLSPQVVAYRAFREAP
ncbi:hypothetical protein [Phenylobacterium sp.]|uniref:hypothetical protein n=1 Tax=Phenylobacterium sp. TaxID=1871053 RepID=UPI002FDA5DBB